MDTEFRVVVTHSLGLNEIEDKVYGQKENVCVKLAEVVHNDRAGDAYNRFQYSRLKRLRECTAL